MFGRFSDGLKFLLSVAAVRPDRVHRIRGGFFGRQWTFSVFPCEGYPEAGSQALWRRQQSELPPLRLPAVLPVVSESSVLLSVWASARDIRPRIRWTRPTADCTRRRFRQYPPFPREIEPAAETGFHGFRNQFRRGDASRHGLGKVVSSGPGHGYGKCFDRPREAPASLSVRAESSRVGCRPAAWQTQPWSLRLRSPKRASPTVRFLAV